MPVAETAVAALRRALRDPAPSSRAAIAALRQALHCDTLAAVAAVVDAERPDLRAGLSCFPPTSPALVPHAGDLARVYWRVNWRAVAERWHCFAFARMLLPAPAGSVLADLAQFEPLEVVGGAVRPHAFTRFGRYYAALPCGPFAGVFALCLSGGRLGSTSPEALYPCDDSPASRTRRRCAPSTCGTARSGSQRRGHRRRPRLVPSTSFGSWRLQNSKVHWRCGNALARTSTGCRV
jgi:hypothetical protein